ncbi:MAG: hypothetical protein FWE15_23805, partial [Actinomycetia bacterium]|nr:hypothetical protein [Actinomycetes bacterium]
QAWCTLRELVRRPFRRGVVAASGDDAPGADEVAALAEAPDEAVRAERLAAVLAARAAEDPVFARALGTWCAAARAAVGGAGGGAGEVRNTVSGGTQDAVVQARDIRGGVHFGSPPRRS